MEALSIFTLVVTVSYSGHKPTRVHSRDNSVNCRKLLTIINYILNILFGFKRVWDQLQYTSDHKYWFTYPPFSGYVSRTPQYQRKLIYY